MTQAEEIFLKHAKQRMKFLDYKTFKKQFVTLHAVIISSIQEGLNKSKCSCSNVDKPGDTKLWCCNICGLRSEEF